MSYHKIAYFRYRQIDELLQTGRIFNLQQLTDEIKIRLKNAFDISYISTRQIAEDIRVMRSAPPVGYNAPIECIRKVGYRYKDKNFSINNLNYTNNEKELIKLAILLLKYNTNTDNTFDIRLQILSKLTSNAQEIPYVLKEPYMVNGMQFINDILYAIQNKNFLCIRYQPYNSEIIQFDKLKPLLLKEFRNRLYVIAIYDTNQKRIVIALDRIIEIKTMQHFFQISQSEFESIINLYRSCIGTSVEYNQSSRKVVLNVSKKIMPYLLSRPLHESQTYVKDINHNRVQFEYQVVINTELISEILKYNTEITVVEPISLKQTVKQLIYQMYQNYL